MLQLLCNCLCPQTLALLEEEADINQITDYFSYEHFYVIYCKFWELDTDHDLFIDPKDLARYNDHGKWRKGHVLVSGTDVLGLLKSSDNVVCIRSGLRPC